VEQMNRARAERVGELLRRYMWARCRCVGGGAPAMPLSELAGRLQWGPCEFDGVRVELNLESRRSYRTVSSLRSSGRLSSLMTGRRRESTR
jgi:hypothetical protein